MQPSLETCFQDSNLFMDTMECVAILVGGISNTVRGHPSEHLLMHGTRHCSKSYTCKAYKTWEQWNSRPVSIVTSLCHPCKSTHNGTLCTFGYFKKDHNSSHTGHHGCMWSKLLKSLPIVHTLCDKSLGEAWEQQTLFYWKALIGIETLDSPRNMFGNFQNNKEDQ